MGEIFVFTQTSAKQLDALSEPEQDVVSHIRGAIAGWEKIWRAGVMDVVADMDARGVLPISPAFYKLEHAFRVRVALKRFDEFFRKTLHRAGVVRCRQEPDPVSSRAEFMAAFPPHAQETYIKYFYPARIASHHDDELADELIPALLRFHTLFADTDFSGYAADLWLNAVRKRYSTAATIYQQYSERKRG